MEKTRERSGVVVLALLLLVCLTALLVQSQGNRQVERSEKEAWYYLHVPKCGGTSFGSCP